VIAGELTCLKGDSGRPGLCLQAADRCGDTSAALAVLALQLGNVAAAISYCRSRWVCMCIGDAAHECCVGADTASLGPHAAADWRANWLNGKPKTLFGTCETSLVVAPLCRRLLLRLVALAPPRCFIQRGFPRLEQLLGLSIQSSSPPGSTVGQSCASLGWLWGLGDNRETYPVRYNRETYPVRYASPCCRRCRRIRSCGQEGWFTLLDLLLRWGQGAARKGSRTGRACEKVPQTPHAHAHAHAARPPSPCLARSRCASPP
jgi:hypothetical protein